MGRYTRKLCLSIALKCTSVPYFASAWTATKQSQRRCLQINLNETCLTIKVSTHQHLTVSVRIFGTIVLKLLIGILSPLKSFKTSSVETEL